MPRQTADDIRTTITNTIIESLEAGGLPACRKPWASDPNGLGLATSLSTDKSNRGINQRFTSKRWRRSEDACNRRESRTLPPTTCAILVPAPAPKTDR